MNASPAKAEPSIANVKPPSGTFVLLPQCGPSFFGPLNFGPFPPLFGPANLGASPRGPSSCGPFIFGPLFCPGPWRLGPRPSFLNSTGPQSGPNGLRTSGVSHLKIGWGFPGLPWVEIAEATDEKLRLAIIEDVSRRIFLFNIVLLDFWVFETKALEDCLLLYLPIY